MPNLFIKYGDLVLHDGDVSELQFSDSPSQVSVVGKSGVGKSARPAAATAVTGKGLMDLLAGARKAQTAAQVEVRREELREERAEQGGVAE